MPITLLVFLLIFFCLILIKSTEMIVASIKYLAKRMGIGKYGITAFVLAFATSLPELVVGITASYEGISSIVLGNVLGSNIADISLVIGGAAVAGGVVKVIGQAIKRDLILVFGAALLPLLLIEDLIISRSDGLVLLAVYVFFVATILRKHTSEVGKYALKESAIHRLLSIVTNGRGRNDMIKFVGGVVLLLFSSHMIVKLSENIAIGMGIPVLLVGLFLIAIGTSLPELVFEMKAVLSGNTSMALGDLLGSVVANATLVLGISAIISPITLPDGLGPYLTAIGAFVVMYLIFLWFSSSKSRITRWEGLTMILLYLLFIFIEFGRV